MKLIDKVKNPTNYRFDYAGNEHRSLLTKATVIVDNYTGTGFSECHSKDADFCSRKVGEHIAFIRAQVDLLNQVITEKQLQLWGIKDMIGSIETNIPHFELDPTNKIIEYVARRECELKKFTNFRAQLKKELNTCLRALDKSHKLVRRLRENKDKNKQLS